MELSNKAEELLKQIEDKYSSDHQPIESYLEGLLHQRYLDYWDYIKLDVLLNLQEPRTNIPDERIFIIYHQITELYFKLIINELDDILYNQNLEIDFLKTRLKRIVNYFFHLANSFSIMREGMDKNQFLTFRMSLLPASGFQSFQYRLIETKCTPLKNLLHKDFKETLKNEIITLQYPHIYWKSGAIDQKTQSKALTLIKFEEKYDDLILESFIKHQNNNIWAKVVDLGIENDSEVKELMRHLDYTSNVVWPNAHVQTAAKYLGSGQDAIGATGGTNWQDYLPPSKQQRKFFPELWEEFELKDWGSIKKEI